MTANTPLATRFYLASDRMAGRVIRAFRGCFDGFWLGVLSDAQIVRIDEAYYSGQGLYTCETYTRSGLSNWERTALDRHFRGVQDVVVTSAGGGREVLALAEAGYRPRGFEPHPELVRHGRSLRTEGGAPIALTESERDGWPSDVGRTDAVIIGWGGYMLIPGRDRRIALLHAAAGALPDDGPVLLSFFARAGGNARFRTAQFVANSLRRGGRRPPVEFGDALVPNRVHFFSRTEIERELAAAGFELVDFGADEYGWAVGRKKRGPRTPTAGRGEVMDDDGDLKLVDGTMTWRRVEDETVVLDLTESTYVGINPAGSLLWTELVAGTTRAKMVALLVRTYDLPVENATQDVTAFLRACRDRGYLR